MTETQVRPQNPVEGLQSLQTGVMMMAKTTMLGLP